MQLTKIQDIVDLQLHNDVKTRESDDYLYIKVLEYIRPNITSRPFEYVLSHIDELGLPHYESVRRTRQKNQAEKPYLKPDESVRRYRLDNEQKYRDYANLERR